MFTLFPTLPTEIRDQIWEQTFEPRLMRLERVHTSSASSFEYLAPKNTAPPTALSVCRESRAVALRRYEEGSLVAGDWGRYGSRDDGERYDDRRRVTMLWDPDIDALHIPRQSLTFAVNRLGPTVISLRLKVKMLVVSVKCERRWDFAPSVGLAKLFVWKGLKEIVYVDEDQYICRDCVEGGPECTGTDGCLNNPRTKLGMGRKAWDVLVEVEKHMSGWVANPQERWMRWRPLIFKVVRSEDQIFTVKFAHITEGSPFGKVTRYSLYLPEK